MSNKLTLKDGKISKEIFKPGQTYYVISEYNFEHHKKCHCNKGFDDDNICLECDGLGYKKEYRRIYHPKKVEIKQATSSCALQSQP